jgi:hypothetical protein
MKMEDFWRIVDRVIYESDILLEVVDARMPNLTRNKKVENKIRRKRKSFILVMNKSDLITKKMRKNFLIKGGRVDEVRTALTIIRDWQKGNLLLNF